MSRCLKHSPSLPSPSSAGWRSLQSLSLLHHLQPDSSTPGPRWGHRKRQGLGQKLEITLVKSLIWSLWHKSAGVSGLECRSGTWSPSPRCGGSTCTACRRAPPGSPRPGHRGGSGRCCVVRSGGWSDWTPGRTSGTADPSECPPSGQVWPHWPHSPPQLTNCQWGSRTGDRGRGLRVQPAGRTADRRTEKSEIFFRTCPSDWSCT